MAGHALANAATLKPHDVSRLAVMLPSIGLSAEAAVVLAESLVRGAGATSPAHVAVTVDGLLQCGCRHEGALAAFRGLVLDRLDSLDPIELERTLCAAASCCAQLPWVRTPFDLPFALPVALPFAPVLRHAVERCMHGS